MLLPVMQHLSEELDTLEASKVGESFSFYPHVDLRAAPGALFGR